MQFYVTKDAFHLAGESSENACNLVGQNLKISFVTYGSALGKYRDRHVEGLIVK